MLGRLSDMDSTDVLNRKVRDTTGTEVVGTFGNADSFRF